MTDSTTTTAWRENQRIELKKHIFEMALQLFRTQGVENTTIQQIASSVGIGKGTFFNHFPSKDHVLQEWYRQITRASLKKASGKSIHSGRDQVLALSTHLAASAARDPGLWDAKVNSTSSQLIRQEENDLNGEVFEFCRDAIQKDLANVNGEPRASAEFLAEVVIAIVTGVAHIWSVSGHQQKLEETVGEHIRFVLDAALANKDER